MVKFGRTMSNVFFAEQHQISTDNYAVGGETAILHSPWDGFLPYSLSFSLNDYYLHHLLDDYSDKLFIIWIGGNDYLNGAENVTQTVGQVVDCVQAAVEELIHHGASNFLIINLPDISKSPYQEKYPGMPHLHELIEAHNAALKQAILNIQNNYKKVNIQLYDACLLFERVIHDPETYNKKYQVNYTNLNNACWQGGYSFKQNHLNEAGIAMTMRTYLNKKNLTKNNSQADNRLANPRLVPENFAHMVVHSPALLEAYQVGEENNLLCPNSENYFFWDHLHPTAVTHSILGKEIIDFIEKHYLLGSSVRYKSN